MTDEPRSDKEIDEENVSSEKRVAADSETIKDGVATPPKKRGRPKKVAEGSNSSGTVGTPVSGTRRNAHAEQVSTKNIATTPSLAPEDEATKTPVSTGRKRGRPAKGTPTTEKKVGRPRKNPPSKNESESVTTCSSDEMPSEPVLKTPVVSRTGRVIRTPMSYQAPTKSIRNILDHSGTPRGRRRRRNSCPDENEQMQENDKNEDSETPSTETKKGGRLSPEEREAKRRKVTVQVKTLKNVVCGVCKKEMLEPNFVYHKYSVHHGLARLEGQSQEFTEQEKTIELRKTLEKLKKLHCKSCSGAFTTLLGYQYHTKRCGKDATDLEEMLQECSVCGKKVMSLGAHLKTHEKRPEPKFEEKEERVVLTPEGKSRRAAALKATNLIREFKEELAEAPPKENVKKALKLLMAPPSQKVSNSTIGAWKKQISATSKASCRYPSCEFSSKDIEKLKEHHVTCEVGAKTQSFGCLKCSFRDPDKSKVLDHILKTHVTEAEFEPVDASSSSEENEESGEDEDAVEEEDGNEEKPKNRMIPHNSKFLDKAYGLPLVVLSQFKSMLNHNVIPIWLAKYHKKHFTWNSSLFTKWQAKPHEILQSPQEFYPSMERSIPFTRRAITNSTAIPEESSFGSLDRFQGAIKDYTPVFFCGGPIVSSAWCPMPLDTSSEASGKRDQYMAISTFREEHQYRSAMISPFESKYLIQIWNCGKLPTTEPAASAPKLALSIAHEFGRVWSLKWCPSGCYDSERLGILAAACSDGTIRCFSVPHPSSFGDTSEPVFVKLDPCVTLKLKTQEGSECTCLSWDETKGHRFIVGGFGNGTVAVWDLETKSPLLSTGDTLYPVWSFYAHSSVVTAVSLDPHHGNARFVATASLDRTIKLWDRNDHAIPVCWSKRSRVTDIKWRRHWPGVTVGVDDFCALFRSSTLFFDFGYTGNRQGLLPQNSVAWDIAENEFLDIIAHCTDAGEVVMYPSHFAVIDCDEKKLRKQRKIIFRTDLIQTETNRILNRMQKVYAQSTKKAITGVKGDAQTTDKSYALIFNESMNETGKHFGTKQPHIKAPASDTMDLLLPSDEPHTSIKSISFNPNYESHNWMSICGENGLVHLLRVETLTLNRTAENYMNEFQKK